MECIEPDHIKFDFLGKDSIRYENTVQVHRQVFSLVKQFCERDESNKSAPPLLSPLSPLHFASFQAQAHQVGLLG